MGKVFAYGIYALDCEFYGWGGKLIAVKINPVQVLELHDLRRQFCKPVVAKGERGELP